MFKNYNLFIFNDIFACMNLFQCNLYLLFWKKNLVFKYILVYLFNENYFHEKLLINDFFAYIHSTTLTLSLKIKPLFYIRFETTRFYLV